LPKLRVSLLFRLNGQGDLKMRYFAARREWFVYLLAVCVFCLCVNCRKENTDKASRVRTSGLPAKGNAIVLKIEETTFFSSDFENYLQSLFGKEYHQLSAASLSRLFDDFIDEKMYLHAAQMQAISISIDEQKRYLAELSRESFLEEGKNQIGKEEFATHLDKLRIEKYMARQIEDVEVTDQEVNEYYEQHKRDFLRPERVKVSQILLQSEDKAIEILEKVKNSTEDEFRALAKNESKGVEAAKGGEMGVFEMGQLPFAMEKVVFSLKVGHVSQVVESAYGYHIFRLDDKYEPELVSEEQAISEIRMLIMNQKIKQTLMEHLQRLKEQFSWRAYPSNLSFEYQRTSHEEM
jgi:parvulin-like peptidyl-prolyl isomerase